MKLIYCIIAAMMVFTTAATAQEKTDTVKKKKKALSIGSNGIQIGEVDTQHIEKEVDIEIGVVDLGVNTLKDNTAYSSAAAQNFLNVPADQRNSNLFSLQNWKSVNVNVWPVLVKCG